ncbi:MAG: acetyl-CoA hydrolase/transferase C-terminal domain-containing protein [Rudaea sp.]|uniref:acetyl-CoA hydrolase/transferase family protein n=1 Tax=Rudaea sp. TaxID=2136325 RepID=UPI0039E4AF54
MTRALRRLTDAFCAGERVFVPALAGESALLASELQADPERARDVDFVGVQFPGIDTIDYLAVHPRARATAFFMSSSIRRGLAENRAQLLHHDYASLARYLSTEFTADVAIAQLSPPDADGFCSAGLSADFLPLAWARAKRRIAHINPRLPRTAGTFRVCYANLDGHVEADAPLLAYSDPAIGDAERSIAGYASTLVRDGDTLQFGIGTVPLALAAALRSHRRLKLHTGMVTRAHADLWEAGALDRFARITTGVALGDEMFHAFVGTLPNLWFTDVGQTHDSRAIAAIENFVAVNSAVEVDLFGQVNSEAIDGKLVAGAGGLPAFAHGALASKGGRSLICLRSTAAGGGVSRIVPRLREGALCTLPRYCADVFITENGVARVRDLSLDARAEALIGIAAPAHRPALVDAWAQMRKKF